MQYEMISANSYKCTSDDIIFQVFALRNDLPRSEYPTAREEFFSKGQACLRTSPLAKTYGFGLHFDRTGKVAMYGMETDEYRKFLNDDSVKKMRAMRSSKK